MTMRKRFNKDGTEIADVGPLLDGQSIRMSMSMMDAALNAHLGGQTVTDTSGVRHSPGYCVPPMSDAQLVNSEAAMAYRKAQLSQAWQTPPAKPAVPPLKKDEAPATDTESLLQARDQRLTEAWRNPPAVLPASSATDTSTTPKPVNAATVTAGDVDAAIVSRNARLEGAWKRGAA